MPITVTVDNPFPRQHVSDAVFPSALHPTAVPASRTTTCGWQWVR
jgi:hypothetical protein